MPSVVEIFETIQGEGSMAGTPSVFVRFAGCNLWSGNDDTRVRDSLREEALCPLWCDTDFRRGTKMTVGEMIDAIARFNASRRLIVFTGGEPLLQLSEDVLLEVRARLPHARISLETNGTIALAGRRALIDHVCVSPKVAAEHLAIRSGEDLKVVVPAYDPLAYDSVADDFTNLFVQPEAITQSVGTSLVAMQSTRQAVDFCLRNPRWRLSLQTHKMIGIP